jgi:hypothetical protein
MPFATRSSQHGTLQAALPMQRSAVQQAAATSKGFTTTASRLWVGGAGLPSIDVCLCA